MKRTFLAGAAETVITPAAAGTFLIGPMKPSTGVHDDLYARALVLSDGVRRAAIVTLDWLGFDFAYNDVLVGAVAKAAGVPPEHVLINCSHTHNAPLTICWGPWEKAKDKPFHRMLPQKLAAVARRARAAMAPARLRYCRGPAQVGINRRYPTADGVAMAPNPEGKIVPWVDVLAVQRPDGRPVAVLFGHAAHPVIVHGASTLITADYPGFAVRTLREILGRRGVFMFAQACGANINGFPLRGGLDAARAAGRDLGWAVARALDSADGFVGPARLRVASAAPDLPLRPPGPAEDIRAKLAARTDGGGREHLERLLAMAEGRRPPTMRFPIRGLALGDDLCILGMAHECFAEYQLYVDRASPFARNMVFGYTNGVECYVATAKDYRLGDRGGYEAAPAGAAAKYAVGSPLAPAAERMIRRAASDVLGALKTGGPAR